MDDIILLALLPDMHAIDKSVVYKDPQNLFSPQIPRCHSIVYNTVHL